MRAALAVFTAGLLVSGLACEGSPTLIFDDDDASVGRPDASLDAPGDTGTLTDAGSADDGSDPIGDFDDAAADASATCGAATVATCAACPGKPILCAKDNQSTCVADCSECAANTLPCTHCLGNVTVARCVALSNKGVLPCTAAARCACDDGGVSECPSLSGAAQVCALAPNKLKCLTCGEAKSSGMPCVTAQGSAGTCTLDPNAVPVCQ